MGDIHHTTPTLSVEGVNEDVPPINDGEKSPIEKVVRIKSVKLLQVRSTSRGGALPFVADDVEDEISPKGIQASQSVVTCANQRFPAAGMTSSSILVRFPDAGGACEIDTFISKTSEIAFNITPFSASTATITAQNGWSADQPDIVYGVGSTQSNTLKLTRNGVSYTMGIDVEGTGAGSFPIYINVTSFSGPN